MTIMITNDQSYILGLMVGGGTLSTDTFSIVLPLDKWGASPAHMGEIATDILTQMQKKFIEAYDVTVTYQILNKGHWKVLPTERFDISPIVKHLTLLGLPTSGQLISSCDLTTAKQKLHGLRAENFLSGIFDARASLTESHRRFFDEAPVVSIEVPGSTRNFNFVMQLCSWLTDLQSVTDQILYNHPCQHSSNDPTYVGWKKGFKIRFLAKSFISSHSFSMKAKAKDASRLQHRQKIEEQLPCNERTCRTGPISIHREIDSADLPPEVRNKLFLHYHHICAALNCPYAPIESVRHLVRHAKEFISVFPLLSKGSYDEMLALHRAIICENFPDKELGSVTLSCSSAIDKFQDFYPDIKTGLAYLFTERLKGKRHTGNQDDIIRKAARKAVDIKSLSDCDGAPLFVGRENINRGFVVSSVSGDANQAMLKKKISIHGIDINVK